MTIKYKTTPLQQFIVEYQSPNGSNDKLTDYICPLCKTQVRKRYFGEHVNKVHALRKDEVFAKLFGLASPYYCSCGKELHYSDANKGFPTRCGKCTENDVVERTYKNAEDAHAHVEKLKELLATAQAEEGADRAEEVGGTAQDKDSGMTRKIQDTFKQAALWLVAITATMFIVCAVMGGIALIIFGAIKWIGG